MTWVLLAVAIAMEVAGTLSMRASEGFTRLGFTLVTVFGYLGAFVLLGMVLKHGMPVGVAYGVWSGAGVALVAMLGRVAFGEPLNAATWAGIALIIAGVWVVEAASHQAA